MHSELAKVSLANIKARIAEGDCPTTKPYSVEMLEELVVHFAAVTEAMREALKPFGIPEVDLKFQAKDGMSIHEGIFESKQPTVGDIRRARGALATPPQAVAPTGEIGELVGRLEHFSKLLGGRDLPEVMAEAATALTSQREHIRKQAEDIMTLGKLVYASETETWKEQATSLRRKLEEARKALAETLEIASRNEDGDYVIRAKAAIREALPAPEGKQ